MRVSICTPTLHRRPFFPALIACVRAQTYPHDCLEWIICEDGEDCIRDLLDAASQEPGWDIPIVYEFSEKRQTLGEKRNRLYQLAKGEILINMDDDDYYPPSRVSHAVEVLEASPQTKLAGCKQMYFYFPNNNRVCLCGPYGEHHANCATFAFHRSLLTETAYDPTQSMGEESFFLKNYTLPIAALSPEKTILVICHTQNSCDKQEVVTEGQPVQWLNTESTKSFLDTIFKHAPSCVCTFYQNGVVPAVEEYELGSLIHKSPKLLVELLERKKKQYRMMETFYKDKIHKLEGDLTQKSQLLEQVLQFLKDRPS